MYLSLSLSLSLYVYIYIYIEREREELGFRAAALDLERLSDLGLRQQVSRAAGRLDVSFRISCHISCHTSFHIVILQTWKYSESRAMSL